MILKYEYLGGPSTFNQDCMRETVAYVTISDFLEGKSKYACTHSSAYDVIGTGSC